MEEIKKGYRRVTEVLHRYVDFSGIDPVVLAKAANRGTRVHGFCSLHAKGFKLPFVDKDCEPYVNSFIKWFDSKVDKVLVNEERFYCDKWRITGAIDLVVKLKDSDLVCIVDLKTPQSTSKSWKLQTAAYQYLYNEANEIKAERRLVLQLKRNGSTPIIHEYMDASDQEIYFGILRAEMFFQK